MTKEFTLKWMETDVSLQRAPPVVTWKPAAGSKPFSQRNEAIQKQSFSHAVRSHRPVLQQLTRRSIKRAGFSGETDQADKKGGGSIFKIKHQNRKMRPWWDLETGQNINILCVVTNSNQRTSGISIQSNLLPDVSNWNQLNSPPPNVEDVLLTIRAVFVVWDFSNKEVKVLSTSVWVFWLFTD